MLERFVKYAIEHTPTWFVVFIFVIIGIMKYGPVFIKKWIEVWGEMKKDSTPVTTQYITMLRSDKENLQRELEKEREKIQELNEKILELTKNSK